MYCVQLTLESLGLVRDALQSCLICLQLRVALQQCMQVLGNFLVDISPIWLRGTLSTDPLEEW